jgi:hypothetical protein
VRVIHAKESKEPNVSTILLACLDSSNAFYSFQYARRRQFEINYPSIRPSIHPRRKILHILAAAEFGKHKWILPLVEIAE